MADYPVTVDVLSRFKSRAEQKESLEKTAAGLVDILIGTHRLLQKDVYFKDLGLVVVDEEQRFGVAHKERLKQFRQMVDVLTLTATPIPRTLHMSLMGIKDISSLNTPRWAGSPFTRKLSDLTPHGYGKRSCWNSTAKGRYILFITGSIISSVSPVTCLCLYLKRRF